MDLQDGSYQVRITFRGQFSMIDNMLIRPGLDDLYDENYNSKTECGNVNISWPSGPNNIC